MYQVLFYVLFMDEIYPLHLGLYGEALSPSTSELTVFEIGPLKR